MTLVKSEESALFHADPAPQTQDVQAVIRWVEHQFRALESYLRRPEWPACTFTRLDNAGDPEFKPEDGMMAFAGPGVLGPQEGLYIRESGVWKKIT